VKLHLFTSATAENGTAAYILVKIVEEYNLTISTNKTKVTAFRRTHPVTSNSVMYDKPIDQVNHFNYSRCTITIFENKDLKTTMSKCNHICGMIRSIE
jgi:hypothetical protein